ncbi:hypothetical protein C8J57DRAFT_1512226 [Mycena rebaudengoi]|nr:hypothetical protein C8J57DRAFT_1512226 [Mycena rebaudengoi]
MRGSVATDAMSQAEDPLSGVVKLEVRLEANEYSEDTSPWCARFSINIINIGIRYSISGFPVSSGHAVTIIHNLRDSVESTPNPGSRQSQPYNRLSCFARRLLRAPLAFGSTMRMALRRWDPIVEYPPESEVHQG